MSAEPPPYRPHFPEGPSAPAFSPALACQPGVFPSSPYQTFPQSYYHEHPGYMAPMTPQSTFGGQSGASYPPKHAVYVVDQQQDRGGGRKSCLAACSTLLCCCCLWDLLTQHLC
ncbi:cysteine-rich and transmembrane domain-containing protein 1-like isoform X2 [Pelmatolapia mariae]|uniref:cysteine-rich and transmembrane domain-containing protein 1-like isoform X2 n=1 Tax=Pelmatolapia mariae TaxID=158779 RepID=UPI002FE5CECB